MNLRKRMPLFAVLLLVMAFVTTSARPSYAATTRDYTVTTVEILDSNGDTIIGAQQTEGSSTDAEGTFTYGGSGDSTDATYLLVNETNYSGGEADDSATLIVPLNDGSGA